MDTDNPHCVIVGASHAGVQTANRVRRLGWTGPITLVGDEPHQPYHRPPLSKDLLKGVKTLDGIRLGAAAGYEKAGIELRLGTRATAIDRTGHRLILNRGEPLQYDALVLATGSSPRRLPLPGCDLAGVHYLRNADDVHAIAAAADSARRAVIVGGGYIGLEVAASLRSLNLEVTVLEAMERVLQRVSCPQMSQFFTRVHTEQGVSVKTGVSVTGLAGQDSVSAVHVEGSDPLDADLVIIGIGIVPNVELAADAGLAIDNGIAVDEYARTSDPNIYAVGDCCSFFHPGYGRRMRLESVQNANDQAVTAARSICGSPQPYSATPWFWSDQYDIKLQICGLSADADCQLLRGEATTGRSFSLLHLKGNRLLAVEAVNCGRDFVQGRKLIEQGAAVDPGLAADASCQLSAAVIS